MLLKPKLGFLGLEVEDIGMVTPRAHVDQKLKETFIMMLRDLGKMRKLAALY